MDYANGKIYKITGGGMTYYGSTTQPLSKRFYTHKSKDCSSKIIIETGEAVIVLVELFPCKSKEELFSRERFYIENNDCVNKIIPMRTKKEYYNENADKLKEKSKKYYNENIDIIKKYKKEYYNENVDKIKEQQKQYYNENADKIKEKIKKYQFENADKIKEQKKQYYQQKKIKFNKI